MQVMENYREKIRSIVQDDLSAPNNSKERGREIAELRSKSIADKSLIESLSSEISQFKRETANMDSQLKKMESELRTKEYRLGKASDEILKLKARIKEMLEKSDSADTEEKLKKIIEKQRTEKYQLKSLIHKLNEYIKNLSEYNKLLIALKHVDVTEREFERDFLIRE